MTKQEIDDTRAKVAELAKRPGLSNTTFHHDETTIGVSTAYQGRDFELTFVTIGDDARDRASLRMIVQSMADLPDRVADEG